MENDFEKVVLLTCRDDIFHFEPKFEVKCHEISWSFFLQVELARLVCLPKQTENDNDKSCR